MMQFKEEKVSVENMVKGAVTIFLDGKRYRRILIGQDYKGDDYIEDRKKECRF